ncbi:MAG: hypothetical protein AAGP08_06135 [Pseudomonadota bacterium]
MRILLVVLAATLAVPSFAAPVLSPTGASLGSDATSVQFKGGQSDEYKEKKAKLDALLEQKEAFLKKHLREDFDRATLEEAEVAYLFYIRNLEIPILPWPYVLPKLPVPKTDADLDRNVAERKKRKREEMIITPLHEAFEKGLNPAIDPENVQYPAKAFYEYQLLLGRIITCRRELSKLR